MTETPMVLPPLTGCKTCHAGCDYATEGETCWGWVSLAWEKRDGTQLHACLGHEDKGTIVGGVYRLPTEDDWRWFPEVAR